jgi:hypothetical protein
MGETRNTKVACLSDMRPSGWFPTRYNSFIVCNPTLATARVAPQGDQSNDVGASIELLYVHHKGWIPTQHMQRRKAITTLNTVVTVVSIDKIFEFRALLRTFNSWSHHVRFDECPLCLYRHLNEISLHLCLGHQLTLDACCHDNNMFYSLFGGTVRFCCW